MDAELNARVKEALDRTEIMALSTIGPDGSWTSPVRFSYSDDLELSFVSLADAKHVANIHEDPRVSVAIYSYPGPPGGNLGLQIKGRAVDLDPHESGWHRIKVVPDELWLFDSRVYGKQRQPVDLSDVDLLSSRSR